MTKRGRVVGVIPARLQSTRLPRKLLLEETGRVLLEYAWAAACRARRLDEVLVAADSPEIVTAVEAFGGQPWLLRFFDQIRFYEVSAEELQRIRRDFPKGRYPFRVEETTFNLGEYQRFLEDNDADIRAFTDARNQAFDEELQRWVESGQINFESQQDLNAEEADSLPEGTPVESPTAGNIWKLTVAEGDRVEEGQVVAVLEETVSEFTVMKPRLWSR